METLRVPATGERGASPGHRARQAKQGSTPRRSSPPPTAANGSGFAANSERRGAPSSSGVKLWGPGEGQKASQRDAAQSRVGWRQPQILVKRQPQPWNFCAVAGRVWALGWAVEFPVPRQGAAPLGPLTSGSERQNASGCEQSLWPSHLPKRGPAGRTPVRRAGLVWRRGRPARDKVSQPPGTWTAPCGASAQWDVVK